MFELPKAYEAKDIEKKWYRFWDDEGFFKADPTSSKPAYCIMIPPPNVTGVLHMGHALVNTLQDILIRYKRMSGFDALWMPGTDHAGIATQTVVERHLFSTQGKRRSDFTRDEFLEIVWNWKEKSEAEIVRQLKALGASCDWSRMRFTMDKEYCHSVRTMFKKLFSEGLIYRDDYLVNWDPVSQTALADDEVEYEERNSFLWYFKYPLVNGTDSIQFATTRPETMLGDTAVAVNPKDERYRHLIGKMLLQPHTGRHIPVIADDHVDPAFGTGVVKVTPAHDHNDYLMGIRHGLPMITIMTVDGKINENGGAFTGMTMEDARTATTQAMKDKGFFIKQEPHLNRVGVSYRSKAVIEPRLSKQWFVKMSAFKGVLKDIVRHQKTRLVPSHWDSTYYHWIDHLHDWCISRQLWWGHRIPIWYNVDDRTQMICQESEELPEEVAKNPDKWVQDPDVLDTWFSSSLWPFATLGWPVKTQELEKYYPNSTLITGHDILFFWVARMLMMGHIALDKEPFNQTFLHGLIYGKSYWRNDKKNGVVYVSQEERKEFNHGKEIPPDVSSKWEKMSKSKGNIIDPHEVIAEFGTDAVRMALASSTTEAPQIDLDLRRFEEYRNFANKIWNGSRFIFLNLDGLTDVEFSKGLDSSLFALEDRWILSKLDAVTRFVNTSLNAYAFDKAATSAYSFFWNEFCAYYLEVSKPVLFGKLGTKEEKENKQKLLAIILLHTIRLLHPMAPFITEELFQLLKQRFPSVQLEQKQDEYTKDAVQALQSKACMVSPYPQPHVDKHGDVSAEFDLLCEIVYAVRNIRGEMKIPAASATDIYITGQYSEIQKYAYILSSLVKTKNIIFQSDEPEHGSTSGAVVGKLKIFVSLPEELVAQEKVRLAKEQERLQKQLEQVTVKLSNTAFLEKAPQNVVNQLLDSKAQLEKQLESIRVKL
jgi:valyl-tRNA synthetase